ncbi:Pyoverdine/dityrosine biosynthesis protein-domain-containing protein [Xylaria arbuscula]|nr:Pyoverdine/dityrosine biosynthesis protein-domain-containing protein [Xylaria arbuscula]
MSSPSIHALSSSSPRFHRMQRENIPSSTKPLEERALSGAIILNRYRIEYRNDWDCPGSILRAREQIHNALERNIPIELVIPAFPFKSSNRSKKVLGSLPDEAERLSLLHLNGLCLAIKDATGSDAFLMIVSDGITYNDILDVSDQEVWRYGQRLRNMAEENHCDCIRFSRICDLVGAEYDSETLDEMLYLANASKYRGILMANTPDGFDVLDAITNDPDISRTYKGYKKFLMGERDDRTVRSRSQTERENSEIAKTMIIRGKAFAETVKIKYPNSIRLSIHPSEDTNKISITMLPQENDIVMTPWHGAVVRGIDGSISMSHAILIPAMTHDIIYADGHPSYFRERSELFNWPDMEVTFDYLYPCGMIIKPANSLSTYPLSKVNMDKTRKLATACSPVILRGFSNLGEYDKYMPSSNGSASYLPWKPSIIQDAKDEHMHILRSNGAALSDVMSEGKLEIVRVKEEKTCQQNTSSVSQCETQSDVGYALFASSNILVRYLPQAYNIDKLQKIRCKWRSYEGPHCVMEHVPLVVRHPTRQSLCVQWHQPWPKWQNSRSPVEISIENGSQNLAPLINSLLVDRRVCLRFAKQDGDILVFDSLAMLYTIESSPSSGIRTDL